MKQDNPDIYVINQNREKAFKLTRENGTLQAEIKMWCRNKSRTNHILVEAIDVVDQIAAAMNQEERLQAYHAIEARLKK